MDNIARNAKGQTYNDGNKRNYEADQIIHLVAVLVVSMSIINITS